MSKVFYALVFSIFVLSLFVWSKTGRNSNPYISSSGSNTVGVQLSAAQDGEYDNGENLQHKDGVDESHKPKQIAVQKSKELEVKNEPKQPVKDGC